jgi:hypothetical protein
MSSKLTLEPNSFLLILLEILHYRGIPGVYLFNVTQRGHQKMDLAQVSKKKKKKLHQFF